GAEPHCAHARSKVCSMGRHFRQSAEHITRRPIRNLLHRGLSVPLSLTGTLTKPTLRATPSLLQIARVEPFREPPVNRSQQFARLLHLALVAPEACEARGSAQFETPRLSSSETDWFNQREARHTHRSVIAASFVRRTVNRGWRHSGGIGAGVRSS